MSPRSAEPEGGAFNNIVLTKLDNCSLAKQIVDTSTIRSKANSAWMMHNPNSDRRGGRDDRRDRKREERQALHVNSMFITITNTDARVSGWSVGSDGRAFARPSTSL